MTTTSQNSSLESPRAILPPSPSPERVLIAMDRTIPSDAALEWTVDRARRTRLTVEVLTVVNTDRLFLDEVVEPLMLAGEQVLNHAGDRLREVLDETSFRTYLATGSPAREILYAADGRDLVVVGTGNATRRPVFHHASMAIRIASSSQADVVVVPTASDEHAAAPHVVVGVQGNGEDWATIDIAVREARLLGASLELVHSWEQPSASWIASVSSIDLAPYAAEKEHLFDGIVAETRDLNPDLSVSSTFTAAAASRALLDAAADASLLVVGSHRLDAIDRFFLGSTSLEVVAKPVCPTLVVRSRVRRAREIRNGNVGRD